MKEKYLEELVFKYDLSILNVIESQINEKQLVPRICESFMDPYYDCKYRMISYVDRSKGFKKIDVNCQNPVHVFSNKKLSVAFVYNQYSYYNPNGNNQSKSPKEMVSTLKQSIRVILTHTLPRVAILGDMNQNVREKDEKETKDYFKFLGPLNLRQRVKEITHPKGGRMRKGTIIDHCLTKNLQGECKVIPFGKSDHHCVLYEFQKSKPKFHYKEIKMKVFDEKIKNKAKTSMPGILKGNITHSNKTDYVTQCQNWLTDLNNSSEKIVKVKSRNCRWWNKELEDLRQQMMQPNLKEEELLYLRNRYSHRCKKAMRQYDTHLKDKRGNPFRNQEKIPIDRLKIDDVVTDDGQKIVNELADNFRLKQEKIAKDLRPNFRNEVNELKNYYKNVLKIPEWSIPAPTLQEFKELLNECPKKPSSGFDNISYISLHKLKNFVTTPLWKIVCYYINNGRFDDFLFECCVTAVFKKSDRLLSKNYRPIAISFCCLRLTERWISKCLLRVNLRLGLLHEDLHGFVPDRGISGAVQKLDHFIKKEKKVGNVCIQLYIDMTAAFDAMNRELIWSVLNAMGMSEKSTRMLQDYLTSDWQMVVKNSTNRSYKFPSLLGVPQGGGASATLFVYCSTILHFLLKRVNNCTIFYADDSCIVLSIPKNIDINQAVTHQISEICRVFVLAGFVVNVDKTVIVAPDGVNIKDFFMVGDYKCEISKETVFLGTVVSHNMSFKPHLRYVIDRLESQKYKLFKECFNRTYTERTQLFNAYIYGIVNFNSPSYLSRATKSDLIDLQVCINKIYRSMEQKRGRSGRPIYKELSKRKVKTVFHLHEEAKLYQVLDYFEYFEKEREELRGRSYSNFVLRQKKLGDPLNYLRTIWNSNGCGKMYNECAFKTKRCLKKKIKKYLSDKAKEVFDYISVNGFSRYELPFQIVLTEGVTQHEWVTA